MQCYPGYGGWLRRYKELWAYKLSEKGLKEQAEREKAAEKEIEELIRVAQAVKRGRTKA